MHSFDYLPQETAVEERFFVCPYCWQRVPALLELEHGSHHTTCECGVCGNLVQVDYAVDRNQVIAMDVRKSS